MLNQCILTGNLGDDPSSHYTPEGLAITHFNIAFKSSAKKKDANWIKVSCFGNLGLMIILEPPPKYRGRIILTYKLTCTYILRPDGNRIS